MLRQLKSAPNLLTLLRLIFVPFVVVAIQQQKYAWALGIFVVAGITDGLDGLLARVLKQKTTLGQYLDPIADKLLLSTMFLMLSIAHIIRWPVTILVFSRDIIILIVCTLLYATGTMRVFRPSWFGKANTAVQILSVPLALIYQINFSNWARLGKRWSIYATVALTTISG
ncbi:MAG: CDP-alcohol phosphatidyltransferase family protein, partial [Candidatus Angelobacter sp.]